MRGGGMSEISKYITIIRPEFMSFCKDACRSATLNHLLFRISGKCKDQPKKKIQSGEVLWYAKTELLTAEMSDAWGVCKVRKEVNGLISMGLIGKTKDPEWGANRTKHFFFGSEQCEVFLKCCEENGVCVIHLDLPAEVKHLIYSSKANDRNIKCSCPEAEKAVANDKSIGWKSYNHQMETMNVSDGNDTSIEAITKTTTKTSYKDNNEEGTYQRTGESEDAAASGASAPTPALASSQDDPTLENTDYQPEPAIPGHDPHTPHLAENCRNWRLMYGGLDAATCQQYQTAIDSLVSPAYQTLQNESDNHSRIASDTPTEEQDGPDGHSNSFSRDHSGSNHHSGGDRQQPAARDTRRTTLTERVAQGALNSQENGDANDLATHPSTSPAGNHRDVGAEQAAALGAQKDVGGQAVGGYEKPEQATCAAPETTVPARRNRKPTAPKVDQAEVETYLVIFDELYREVTGDPDTGYGHTGVDRKAIIDDLLKPKLINPKFVTPEKLRAVYRHLFKKPKDEKTGFCWADNMSIKAVCRNYATEAMALTTQAQQQAQARKTAQKPKEPTAIELLRAQRERYVPTGGALHA
jgi:hypothetical protein